MSYVKGNRNTCKAFYTYISLYKNFIPMTNTRFKIPIHSIASICCYHFQSFKSILRSVYYSDILCGKLLIQFLYYRQTKCD